MTEPLLTLQGNPACPVHRGALVLRTRSGPFKTSEGRDNDRLELTIGAEQVLLNALQVRALIGALQDWLVL